MKRILTIAAFLMFFFQANAQNTAFIKTDSILAAYPDYAAAQKAISAKADAYRAVLEADLKVIDELYNTYQSQKQYLNSSAKASREQQIITLENALKDKQNKYFGDNGIMEKTSAATLTPIKDKVNAAIKSFAVAHGYSMVVDISISSNIVYYDEKYDITDKIIEMLNKTQL